MLRNQVHRIIVGELETNCYLLWDRRDSALIIDPGAEGEKIEDEIISLALEPAAVILTHGHYDHIGAANFIAEAFSIPIFADEDEMEMLKNPEKNFSAFVGEPVVVNADVLNRDVLNSLNIHLRLMKLPGHTRGSIGLLDEKFLICGDVVFAGGGIGRTDLPDANPYDLADSIEKILQLPDDIVIMPGHGGRSYIKKEREIWQQGVKMLREDLF